MRNNNKIQLGIMAIVFTFLMSSMAYAVPFAEFTYVETDLGTGMWQYDYTLTNASDPLTDAGYDLYEVFFEYDFGASFSVLSLPTDWDSKNISLFLKMNIMLNNLYAGMTASGNIVHAKVRTKF